MKKTKTLIITAAAVSMLALAACTQNVTEDKNVQDDITGESVSYIFITDLHLDTSEDAQTAAYRQLNAVVDVVNNTDIDFVCVGGDLYNGRDAEQDGKQKAMDKIESVSEILEECDKPVFILK